MSHARGLLVESEEVETKISAEYGAPKAAAALFGAVTSLPDEAMQLAQHLVNFRDQRDTPSCTGHALCRGADARLRVQGIEAPYGAPLASYTLGCQLGQKTAGEKLDLSNGAYTRLVMEGARWGIPPENVWGFDDYGKKLPPDVLQRASAWKVDDYFRVYASGVDRVRAFAQAINNKYPLIVETWTDAVFNAYDGKSGDAIPAPTTKTGAHAVVLLAYRTRNGKKQFLLGNHWSGWGLPNSLAWVSEEWVMATMAAFALTFSYGPSTGGMKPPEVTEKEKPLAEEVTAAPATEVESSPNTLEEGGKAPKGGKRR